MYRTCKPRAIALAVAASFSHAYADTPTLEPVVVTAPAMAQPLTIVTDPKAPRQPIPAQDGADILKTVPGFSVIRKAGTDGDPVFRGMAGSRLNILLDGEHILGGCGNRMDPPTAYVFPESYDSLTILKGPQSVSHGPGNSAATVLFEKKDRTYKPDGSGRFYGSLTGGSFGRLDGVLDARGGTDKFYVQGTATHNQSDDYKSGTGRSVHSKYQRWSTNLQAGLTPDANTRIELSAAQSDGEAAYGDRTMDGTKFARDNVGLKLDKKNINGVLARVEAQVYRNYIDHVMDNFTLRDGTTLAGRMLSNPDRLTLGGRAAATLNLGNATQAKLGLDTQTNKHTLRSGMGAMATNYTANTRVEDANFDNYGLFGELTHFLNENERLIGGLRADFWKATDRRATVRSGVNIAANPTANATRKETLSSGFMRYEKDLNASTQVYAGLGHSERAPDYWEVISASKESADSTSAFNTKPEKTTQLDIGLLHQQGPLSFTASGFYNEINDYIMIQSGYVKSGTAYTITRNIDARTVGGELGVAYQMTPHWKSDASLAYVRGENRTDGTPLAQLPPLEARLGLTWDNQVWSVGSLLRLVARQDRYDLNKGNIVGQDLGATGGFAVFSLNTSYRPKKGLTFSAGVDNLFNRTYAEHLSRTGSVAITGYDTTTRINEPGRLFWLKAQMTLD